MTEGRPSARCLALLNPEVKALKVKKKLGAVRSLAQNQVLADGDVGRARVASMVEVLARLPGAR